MAERCTQVVNAEGGVARRGLHAGLIKAPPPSRRSPAVTQAAVSSIITSSSSAAIVVATASTSASTSLAVAPPSVSSRRDEAMLTAAAPWTHHQSTSAKVERGRERRRPNAWQASPSQMEEYQLDEGQMATLSSLYDSGQKFPQQPLVKGIRAVSIMDTLSQLAGTEALAASRRHQLRSKAALPATPTPSSPTSTARIRARGRTPDWIKRIFEFAKRGQLDQLRASLRDMEATLVRNLSDHHGNNLLHVLAGQGHTTSLAWLCTSLQGAQSQLEGALADENRSGLTPAACAVKYGHTSCVEWLVTNTRLRDKLTTRDGERCLLHTAAKYNQESVLRWLVLAMRSRHIDLDQRDHSGDCPLHLAARAGGMEPCRLLLANGADVSLKNDAGLKASDVAYAAGHTAVQHYLNLFEASLGVAGDFSKVQGSLDALQSENNELRGYFRDVLSVGKRLAKERDEMCRDALGRLHKMAGLAVHDKMAAEVAELAEENRALRERLGLVAASSPSAEIRSLHSSPGSSRMGGTSTSWLVSGLADMEHRLLMAEEGWRKLMQRSTVPSSSSGATASGASTPTSPEAVKKPLDILQRHIDQIEQQQKSSASVHLTLDEARSLSSSESSLDTLLSLRSSGGDNIYSQLLDTSLNKQSTPKPPPPPSKMKRENKEEIKRRLHELALTSESGNASVLEVIEPTTSEDEEIHNKTMPFLATSSPRLKALSISLENELEKIPSSSNTTTSSNNAIENISSRRYSSVHNLLDNNNTIEIDNNNIQINNINSNNIQTVVVEPLNQPDLLMGTVSMDETGDDEIVSSDSPQNSTPTPDKLNKKRTFLQKFSLKASWPSKRKVNKSSKNTSRMHHEISADDFKETYMSQRNILGDASPCSTSSASQQELSSEEVASSGGVATRTASSGSSTTGSEGSGQKSDRTNTGQTRATIEAIPSKSNSPANITEEIETNEIIKEDEVDSTNINSTNSEEFVDNNCVEQNQQEEPPPPVRLIPNSPPSRHLSKTSLAEMKSGQLQHHIESMSVTTSEDSGIVARPSSSASKSDSLLSSRPDSSSSSSFKAGLFPLRLSTTELMNATSSTSGRISPAPSDASKPDSTRHLLSKIDEARLVENNDDKLKPIIRGKLEKKKISSSTIVSTSSVENMTAETSETKVEIEVKATSKRSERAWYDLSDEEPDLLSSAALIRVKRTSSDEEANS